jgi:hypothetical protein
MLMASFSSWTTTTGSAAAHVAQTEAKVEMKILSARIE